MKISRKVIQAFTVARFSMTRPKARNAAIHPTAPASEPKPRRGAMKLLAIPAATTTASRTPKPTAALSSLVGRSVPSLAKLRP